MMKVVAAIVVILVILYLMQQKGGQKIKVYGSMDCSWTRKQLTNLQGRSEFFDCNTYKCPDFVKGFPTSVKDGQVYEGYQDKI